MQRIEPKLTGLSGNEIYCMRLKGLKPSGVVIGNIAYSVERAMTHAKQAGANAVVGIRTNVLHFAGSHGTWRRRPSCGTRTPGSAERVDSI